MPPLPDVLLLKFGFIVAVLDSLSHPCGDFIHIVFFQTLGGHRRCRGESRWAEKAGNGSSAITFLFIVSSMASKAVSAS